jgi:hypothetical protein
MASYIAIGIGAGLASSMLFVAAANLSLLSFALFLFAPLPLFIAGLGWRSIAAGIGALAGSLVIAGLFGFTQGLMFFVSIGLAPVILCHLAWLSRPADQGGDVEWYPMGRLVIWAAAIAGALVTVSVLRAGPGAEAYYQNMKAGLDQMMALQPDLAEALRKAGAEQLDALIAFFIRVTPMVMAALWTLILTGNIWLGTKVMIISGRSPRPWPAFSTLEFPRPASIALGACLVGALLPGTVGLIAEGFAAALVCAFAVLGLAVIHYVTRNFSGRMLVLATAYMAIIMFNWLAALIFAALGVAETGFGLRARKDAEDGGGPSV